MPPMPESEPYTAAAAAHSEGRERAGEGGEPPPRPEVARAYDPRGERPLGPYSALTATFAALLAAGWAALRRSGRAPERLGLRDSVRIGIATHKLARIIAKDKVTSPYRAPFTRFRSADDAPPAEVSEEPRGGGLRYAVGELLGCPYCLAPWIASALIMAEAASPREARALVAMLEAVTVADFLQILYRGAEERLL
jgi:hypothetical protein